MNLKKKENIFLSIMWVALLFLIFFIPFSYFNGIPFIEKGTIVKSGDHYGFKIGMSREESFEIVKKEYNKEGNLLYSFWNEEEEDGKRIRSFQETLQAVNPNRSSGVYREKINKLGGMLIPYALGNSWEIEIPSFLDVSVRLKFSNNKLVEIRSFRAFFRRDSL